MHRGKCSFVTKGNVAEAAGASAMLIINNEKGLFSQHDCRFTLLTSAVVQVSFQNINTYISLVKFS